MRIARAVVAWITRRWLLVSIVVGLLLTYAALGYWYAPRLLQQAAQQWVRDNYHRELTVGSVRVDPFRLRLELKGIALPDADGAPLLGFSRLLVDFEVASLWRRALVFRAVELDAPLVRAVRRSDGRFNLADLALPSTTPEPAEPAPPPRLWIRSLSVTAGNAEYVDAARAVPLRRSFSPINFQLQDFRTTAEGGQFSLAARSAADEAFEWHGRFAMAPALSSSGDFSVSRLRVAGVWELLPETLPAVARGGELGVHGRYAITLADEARVTLDLPELAITGLAIGPRAGDEAWLTAGRIALESITLDTAARSANAAQLKVAGLEAKSWLGADGAFNLAQLWTMPPQAGAESAVTDAVPGAAAPVSPAAPWNVQIAATQIEAAVDFEDRRGAVPQRLRFAPIVLTTGAVGSDLAQSLPVNLQATLNERATLKLEGTLTPAPLAASLALNVQALPLALLKSYALPQAALTVQSGTLATQGQLVIATQPPAAPAVRFDGDVRMEGLRTVDNLLRQDLLNFRSLALQKVSFSTAPAKLGIGRVLVQEPYARLVISPEQVLNISAALNPGAAAQPRPEPAPKPEKPRRDRRSAKPAPAPAPKTQAAAETMPVRIGAVELQRGRVSFTDLNIQPNFAAEIRELSGRVAPVSSARDARAEVKLSGNLGEFSPVTIEGALQPFAFDRFTSIRMKFGNIALPVFNPYSGVFAGFNIAKGSLDTELSYEIADRNLKAGHHIRIDQLEWGEASAYKGEATMPVKFATALLRDRHGVIDLNLPVTGSLDDPKLRIGPLVWQILRNIIVKAATAPFALLGSLFKGAEDAQHVSFAPGVATLDAAAAEGLAALAKGLAEREGISLDVPLAVIPELDRPALVEERLRVQIQARAPADDAARVALEQQLRPNITVTDGELEQLAQARSEAVQRALLGTGELPPSRVFIVREGKVTAQDGKVQLELELK
jgi:hypothetical protein